MFIHKYIYTTPHSIEIPINIILFVFPLPPFACESAEVPEFKISLLQPEEAPLQDISYEWCIEPVTLAFGVEGKRGREREAKSEKEKGRARKSKRVGE